MDHATRGSDAPEGHALYRAGDYVTEDRRGSRVGRIISAWEHHLRPATAVEAAAHQTDRAGRQLPQ